MEAQLYINNFAGDFEHFRQTCLSSEPGMLRPRMESSSSRGIKINSILAASSGLITLASVASAISFPIIGSLSCLFFAYQTAKCIDNAKMFKNLYHLLSSDDLSFKQLHLKTANSFAHYISHNLWLKAPSFSFIKSPQLLRPADYPFSQTNLINLFYTSDEYNKTKSWKINKNYKGLCEIICNYLLINNLFSEQPYKEFFEETITLPELEKKAAHTHILERYSKKEKILARFFDLFPRSILGKKDQKRLIKPSQRTEVNLSILEKNLKKIDENTPLKIEVFKTGMFSFSGHSLLLKKTSSQTYSLFDPNHGLWTQLSVQEVAHHLNFTLWCHFCNKIAILNGDLFIQDALRADQ